ncbi:KaiC domain-containing protein [Halovenus rubra]|uniref:KaiC domain-containing protein n=2 Tax=Halovenus rubra TaxID=869890 RepID=A0ABD5XC64_9EURY
MSDDERSDDDWFEQGLRETDDAAEEESDWDAASEDEDTKEVPEGTESDKADDGTTSWVDDVDETDTSTVASNSRTEDGKKRDSTTDWTERVDTETEGIGPDDSSDDAVGSFGPESSGKDEDDSELFDEGFGDALGSSKNDNELSEEEYESDIPRLNLGIEGLDQMVQGGVPRKHLMVVIGSAGTGKTTFGLQFLNHGLENGEKTVFITLEQSHEAINATANEWGWDFDTYEDNGKLAVVDLDPVEMANSLDNIQAELPELIEDFGADRLVLDSVSLLEMMYDNQANRRTEVFDFTRSLKDAGVTTFLTSEASETNPYASRHGIIEYLTDAVFILQYVRGETQETRLAVEIQKIRNANHSREQKPYAMTDDGISVYQQANIF